MTYRLNAAGQRRLSITTSTRSALFCVAATGVSRSRSTPSVFFSDAERKSIEPIAAMACGDEQLCRAYHDQLLHFVGVSPWSDRGRAVVRVALRAVGDDDARGDRRLDHRRHEAFPSRAISRPVCSASTAARWEDGQLGQIGVSVTIATPTQHLPIDMDLYLPRSWTDDRARCRAAHIPDGIDVGYRPKWQIALDLIRRNVEAGVPVGLMLADSGWATSATSATACVRSASTTRWTSRSTRAW